jgi:transposase
MTHPTTLTAGIDTAKDKLDVAVHTTSTRLSVENRPSGYQPLAIELRRIGVTRVGIEATGGYERGVPARGSLRGHPVAAAPGQGLR